MSKGGGGIRVLDEERRGNGGGREMSPGAEKGKGERRLYNRWEGA